MKTCDFDYYLPKELIAQTPIKPRDSSRLMIINRADGSLRHRYFYDIVELLQPGDVMVFNDSRVIPARLRGRRMGGGNAELLLLRRLEKGLWEALVKPSKNIRVGDRIELASDGDTESSTCGEVVERGEEGLRTIHFAEEEVLGELGQVALPPYIHTPLGDPERYQTVYSREKGSVAAPTAGLHFTPQLIDKLEKKGVESIFVTLHIGLDTFRPVREEDPHQHPMHSEYGEVTEVAAAKLSMAKAEGRRVISVGTTAVRLLEQAALASGEDSVVKPFRGWTDLFIFPGHRFRLIDCLITNFHLPRSTLLMLVSAFADKDTILNAYQEAAKLKYRFYSFGDAMMIF